MKRRPYRRFAFKSYRMELLGYLASILIGISLGLTGSGGAVLTLPLLVYIFHVPPVPAITYSLFVVGASSLTGVIPKYRQGLVDVRTAFAFGAPSITAVILTRKFIVPAIPEILFRHNRFTITKDILLMFLFGALMILAAIYMLRRSQLPTRADRTYPLPVLLIQGAITGIITGLVGAGGGFLIIPALMLFSNMSIHQAAGTSLLIITANSLIGFAAAIPGHAIDWRFLGIISIMAITGIFIGNYLGRLIAGTKLKTGFGVFILSMGIYVIIREVTLVTF